jgi:hypothetical protein
MTVSCLLFETPTHAMQGLNWHHTHAALMLFILGTNKVLNTICASTFSTYPNPYLLIRWYIQRSNENIFHGRSRVESTDPDFSPFSLCARDLFAATALVGGSMHAETRSSLSILTFRNPNLQTTPRIHDRIPIALDTHRHPTKAQAGVPAGSHHRFTADNARLKGSAATRARARTSQRMEMVWAGG